MADSPHESEREDEQQATHVDLAKMKKYIRKITLIFFDDDDFLDTQKPLDTALSDPANNEFIKRFISDSQIRAIVVRGSTNKGTSQLNLNIKFVKLKVKLKFTINHSLKSN